MKKFLSLAFICLISFSFILTGCNLFPTNQANYLSAPIVTFQTAEGENIKIDKEDLITAFNSYGAELVNSYGYSIQDAIDATIEVLINREVMLLEAERTITLGNGDLNEIWDDAYDTIISNLSTYEELVIEQWKLNVPSTLDEEEESETAYTPYKPQAEIVLQDGKYVIKLLNTNTSTDQNVDLYYNEGEEITSLVKTVNDRLNNSANKDVLTEAKRQYVEALKESEEGRNLSTNSDEVFAREVERIYEAVKDNKYIELYSEKLQGDNDISNITLSQVLRKLTADMLSSYTKYTLNATQFDTDMLDSRENVDYVVNNNYFYVNHILLKYDESSTTYLDELETLYKNGTISEKAYNDALEVEAEKIKATNIQTGKETNLSPMDIYDELVGLMTGKSDEAKTQIFKDHIYTYNEDTGNMNADYCYVIGKDSSRMVDTFTETSRKLWDNGKGEYGAIDYCVSEYGVHIIFYAGPVTNAFTISDPDNFNLNTDNMDELTEIVNTLKNTYLNAFNNKTLFDKVYEELATDSYTIFETMNLDVLKKEIKNLTIHISNYQDLLG
ncbi:MAG TPA: hypothetical protein IAA62_00955 [Candidatus Caccopulliclostridium gallistercoris]|uniref:Peptidylprolyl isomerase n=1 Tax=Candidatus Caccopulliclostridium gallistercoris TaxID=2840719 RepID=A0A9D1NEQ4_9FIRM|nr:hypothetical protein [Candidatus Caccopulliclostridium gallistercoris]